MELSEDPHLETILWGLFLIMYMIALLGKLLIILVVISDSHLHSHVLLPLQPAFI
jgi:olfactory receptor